MPLAIEAPHARLIWVLLTVVAVRLLGVDGAAPLPGCTQDPPLPQTRPLGHTVSVRAKEHTACCVALEHVPGET